MKNKDRNRNSFSEIWTSLNQLRKFRFIWTSLNQFGQFELSWTDLNQFGVGKNLYLLGQCQAYQTSFNKFELI